MSTSTIQSNIIYGIGEGAQVTNTTMLAYALRWANAAYRDIKTKPKVPVFDVRTIFRTADGQQTYQMPDDFIGFVTLKDEEANNVVEQVTPEEFTRRVEVTKITDETWTSSSAVAVSLSYNAIVQYSETVTTTAGTTTYTRDTDYTMDYVNGTVTMIAGGSLTTATDYYIDYSYYQTNPPSKFCLEYDNTNEQWVARLEPTPDDEYIMSLVYPAKPDDLSSTVDPVWNMYEYAIERGGIFFGALELIENENKINRFERLYQGAIADLIVLQNDLVPKRDRIRVAMRRQDYYGRQTGAMDDA